MPCRAMRVNQKTHIRAGTTPTCVVTDENDVDARGDLSHRELLRSVSSLMRIKRCNSREHVCHCLGTLSSNRRGRGRVHPG